MHYEKEHSPHRIGFVELYSTSAFRLRRMPTHGDVRRAVLCTSTSPPPCDRRQRRVRQYRYAVVSYHFTPFSLLMLSKLPCLLASSPVSHAVSRVDKAPSMAPLLAGLARTRISYACQRSSSNQATCVLAYRPHPYRHRHFLFVVSGRPASFWIGLN